jgi:hypothetical protein
MAAPCRNDAKNLVIYGASLERRAEKDAHPQANNRMVKGLRYIFTNIGNAQPRFHRKVDLRVFGESIKASGGLMRRSTLGGVA